MLVRVRVSDGHKSSSEWRNLSLLLPRPRHVLLLLLPPPQPRRLLLLRAPLRQLLLGRPRLRRLLPLLHVSRCRCRSPSGTTRCCPLACCDRRVAALRAPGRHLHCVCAVLPLLPHSCPPFLELLHGACGRAAPRFNSRGGSRALGDCGRCAASAPPAAWYWGPRSICPALPALHAPARAAGSAVSVCGGALVLCDGVCYGPAQLARMADRRLEASGPTRMDHATGSPDPNAHQR